MKRLLIHSLLVPFVINAQAQTPTQTDTTVVSQQLNEASVVVQKISHSPDRDTFLVTATDIAQFRNPLQLIGVH